MCCKQEDCFSSCALLQIDWDEPLPKELEQQWGRRLNDLPIIKNLKTPRCLVAHDKPLKSAQLHHFSDASEYGYGAVAYLFMTFADGSVSAQLMMARSRLAPLKGSIIPRLELAGALEAVQLDKLLQREFKIPLEESVFWTDITIVLWYVQSPRKRFQTYIANRVAKILEHNTASHWKHVPSSENPGDDTSRLLKNLSAANDGPEIQVFYKQIDLCGQDKMSSTVQSWMTLLKSSHSL